MPVDKKQIPKRSERPPGKKRWRADGRNSKILVEMTEDEKSKIHEGAQLAGEPDSPFVRNAALAKARSIISRNKRR